MNNQSIYKTALKYGTITGLGNFVFFLLIYFMGKNPLGNWSWLGAWISILLIILGSKEHRNLDLGGYMTYGRGLGMGTLITVFGALLFGVLLYSFGNFIDAGLAQMQIDEFYQGMEQAKKYLSEDKYSKIMETFEANKSDFNMSKIAISNFEIKVLGGFIVSLVTAGILSKKRPMFFEDTTRNDPSDIS